MKQIYSLALLALLSPTAASAALFSACLPEANFSATRVCEGSPTTFTNQSLACPDAAIVSYQWFFGDALASSSTLENPEFTYKTAGTFTVLLVVTDSNGESDTVHGQAQVIAFPDRPEKIPVSYAAAPLAKFNYQFYGEGVPAQVSFNNESENATSFSWMFGTGESSNAHSPEFTFNEAGNYQVDLVAINEDGCTDTASATITLKAVVNIYIPTAFTPDGDGANDFLSVSADNVNSFSLTVFNRFGEKVFETKSPNFKWDGSYLGENLATGVYPTVLRVSDNNGGQHLIQSRVSIIR